MEKRKFGKIDIWKNVNLEKSKFENGTLKKWNFGKMELWKIKTLDKLGLNWAKLSSNWYWALL